MRHVKRSEELDSIDPAEPADSARRRFPARSVKGLLAVILALALGGLGYYFAEQLLGLWSPTTAVTEPIRLVLGGGVAVLVLALSVLVPAAGKARRARLDAAPDAPEALTQPVPTFDAAVEDQVADGVPSGPSPEEMMLSLESELSAAAAELAAELERAANEDVPVDPYGVDGSEPNRLEEEPPATMHPKVIVAVDPPPAMTAIPIPVWVDVVADDNLSEETTGDQDANLADPVPVDHLGPVAGDAVAAVEAVMDAPVEPLVDDTPDADGNTNPTVRVLQAQIRSLEEALFRQAAAEGHPPEPQPELPRAASKDEVTREVLARVRHTIRGLGVRMDADPAAADVLARVEAAVDRLAETGFFVRPTLTEPDADTFANPDAAMTLEEPPMEEPLTTSPTTEEWASGDRSVTSTELAAEFAPARTATAVIDDRPLAERLATEVFLEETETPEPVTDQADIVLPVPASSTPAPPVQRSRRWRRGTPVA